MPRSVARCPYPSPSRRQAQVAPIRCKSSMTASARRCCRRGTTPHLQRQPVALSDSARIHGYNPAPTEATPLVVAGGVLLHLGQLGADGQIHVLAADGHPGAAAQWTVVWKAVRQQRGVSIAQGPSACIPLAIRPCLSWCGPVRLSRTARQCSPPSAFPTGVSQTITALPRLRQSG